MSKNDDKHSSPRNLDPLLFGPRAEPEERGEEVSSSGALSYDPRKSNPLQDLFVLFFSPRKFFHALGAEGVFTRWVKLKALLGFFVFVWISETQLLRFSGAESLSSLFDEMRDNPAYSDFYRALPWDEWLAPLQSWTLAFQQMRVAVAPFFLITAEVLTAGMATLVLLLMGTPERRATFSSVFFAFLFTQWLAPLSLIPFVGPIVRSVWISILGILALKWMYRIGFFRAMVAAHMIMWLVSLAIFGVAAFIFFGFAFAV